MDRSALRTLVEREIKPLMERLGVPHWHIAVEYGLREDDPEYKVQADCTRIPDRNTALIRFDPDEIADEDHARKVLRHELFHVVISPFDLYAGAADGAMKDAAMKRVLERVWEHSVEKAVINLERMYLGLVKPCPTSSDHPPQAITAAKTASKSSPPCSTTGA